MLEDSGKKYLRQGKKETARRHFKKTESTARKVVYATKYVAALRFFSQVSLLVLILFFIAVLLCFFPDLSEELWYVFFGE